jgi:hypothetical protein
LGGRDVSDLKPVLVNPAMVCCAALAFATDAILLLTTEREGTTWFGNER